MQLHGLAYNLRKFRRALTTGPKPIIRVAFEAENLIRIANPVRPMPVGDVLAVPKLLGGRCHQMVPLHGKHVSGMHVSAARRRRRRKRP